LVSVSGYSGKPLAVKLGMRAGYRVYVCGAPTGYMEWLGVVPEGVVFTGSPEAGVDMAHVFSVSAEAMRASLDACRGMIRPGGVIWASWPKRASGVKTDITEDVIRDLALPMGLVDVKVCAVSEVWSGLKLVIRRELRGGSS
jgi:hypothetical protein